MALTSIPAQALDDNLVYVAVEPCRLADTRPTEGGEGHLALNEVREFEVYGTVAGQGGNAGGCPHPRAGTGVEPLAISAYVVAVFTTVPADGVASTGGNLTAFASDAPTPSNTIATVNYATGQVNGNTTNVTLCSGSCPGGQMSIIAFSSPQNVVIDVQGYYYPAAGSCSDDMVAAGSVCIDKYEASVWDAATSGNQYNPTGDTLTSIPCDKGGADCSDGAATPIYARSVAGGVIPALNVTWYQAAIACANVDKRLPTTAEWQMAAAGTPEGTGTDCNIDTAGVTTTGTGASCISTIGAYDMVGNLAEWAAELDISSSVNEQTTTNNTNARGLGDSWAFNGAAITKDLRVMVGTGVGNNGPLTSSSRLGFRCVR